MFDDPDQYTVEDNLRARISLHARFSTAAQPWYDWMRATLDLGATDAVLEMGCGPGDIWQVIPHRAAATVLLDSSPAMISKAAQGTGYPAIVADAAHIPLRDEHFDVVIANHMLYHLADPKQGIAEAARLLRQSGRFVAATNGLGHMGELDSLTKETPIVPGFNLNNGESLLSQHFETVQLCRFDDGLEITDPDAAVRYLASYRSLRPDRMRTIHATVSNHIDRVGCFRVTKSIGAFICRNPRH